MNEIVIKIEGLDELIKSLQALAAGKEQHVAVQTPAPQQAVPVQVSQPVPVTVPQMQQGMPQQVQPQIPVRQSVNTQVPTTAAPQQYSFDQLAVALSNLCANMGKQQEVHNLLNQFGVNDLFSLPKERYGDFATAMRGIGGVI